MTNTTQRAVPNKTKIRRLLISNRGEVVCRIIRTCRKLSISTVAVYSHADRNAPFVTLADEAVFLGPSSSTASYLNADKILQIALERKVDAIHPGYGFLSENAEFCKKCEEAGIIFVGPTSDAIAAMGSKIGAKRLLEEKEGSAIPLIPGYQGDDQSDDRLVKEALRVGFPVLLKASAGGGGRGMRVVRGNANTESQSELEKRLREAIGSARTESQNAFGDGTLLVERYFDRVKHIEIQIVGDSQGNLIHLFERECSVQRRHQKVIEESPSPIMTPDLRSRMGLVAVKIGKAIDYKSLGTVEFIVDTETHNFYFLEVNTRLQVEHPVTEAITGLDLVEVQLKIAEGMSLSDLSLSSSVPGEPAVQIHGHAIEVRLYAEDPSNNFFPCTGTLLVYRESNLPGMRYDSGVLSGSEISIYYDPMISKVVAHSNTRTEAIDKMIAALSSTVVLGLQTNKLFLRQVLQNSEFQAGNFDTGFIDSFLSHEERARITAEESSQNFARESIGTIGLLSEWIRRNNSRGVLKHLPSGWRNNPSSAQQRSVLVALPSTAKTSIVPSEMALEYHEVSSPYTPSNTDSDTGIHAFEFKSTSKGNHKEETSSFKAVVHQYKTFETSSKSIIHEWVDASINGTRRQYHVAAEASNLNYPHGDSIFYIHSEGLGIDEYRVVLKSRFNTKSSDVDGLGEDEKYAAPMPGKVLKLLVEDKSVVVKGDAVVVMESMKMETKIIAHRDGVISFKIKEGDLVEENVALFLIEQQPK